MVRANGLTGIGEPREAVRGRGEIVDRSDQKQFRQTLCDLYDFCARQIYTEFIFLLQHGYCYLTYKLSPRLSKQLLVSLSVFQSVCLTASLSDSQFSQHNMTLWHFNVIHTHRERFINIQTQPQTHFSPTSTFPGHHSDVQRDLDKSPTKLTNTELLILIILIMLLLN